jgi:hypothetical protein
VKRKRDEKKRKLTGGGGCNSIGGKSGMVTAAVEEADQVGVLRREASLPSNG